MRSLSRKTNNQIIATKDKLDNVNKNNILLKRDFLIYLKSIKRSEGTITGYDSDLNIVFVYILDNLNNKDFAKLTKRELVGFQNWMIERDLSSNRIRRIKSAISSLSNYCENILADDDPEFEGYRSSIRKIENPPLQLVREKTVWSDEELTTLLNTLIECKKYERACYVALAMYSGRRKAELARFKVSDFSDERLICDGALYKSEPILTKGNKYLECYTLAKKFKPYLDMWMDKRSEDGIDSIWLFPDRTDTSKHIKPSTFDGWSESFTKIAGKDFYPHSLRHYYCTALVKAGIPDNVIVDIIGWSSSEMLKLYDDSSKDDKLDMYFSGGDIAVKTTPSFDF